MHVSQDRFGKWLLHEHSALDLNSWNSGPMGKPYYHRKYC
jgi:hypothetical protein